MKNLFIVYGGPGREREVSISTGENVMESLGREGVAYESILINQDSTWVHKDITMSQAEGVQLLRMNNALVFQVVHGTFGEDGELVALLEANDVSCIGSSSDSMRLTIDKYRTEKQLVDNNIATTESTVVRKLSDIEHVHVTFPVFVKPKDEGSSISLFKVKNDFELRKALEESVPIYGAMLVQSFVAGRELTCGVVETEGKTMALVPTEVILTKGEMFDYEAKYTVGGSKEITPAEIGDEVTKRVQELALRVHTVCGCRDISRTDMILTDEGEIVVLEINTIPGMTKTSLIPAQLEASGYSVADFVKGMLEKYQ